MPKYRVNWQEIVSRDWSGTIDASSEEEALAKLKNGETVADEEITDETIFRIENEEVEGEE